MVLIFRYGIFYQHNSIDIKKHSLYMQNNSSLVFPSGFPLSTLVVLFVTYCGVQLIKERERKQALLDEPEPVPTPEPGKQKSE